MMARLFDREGGVLADVQTPDFPEAPDLLIWESRFFVPAAESFWTRSADDKAYVEATAYAVGSSLT